MSDGEYDVFGDLDALCKKQTLKHFEEVAPSQPNTSSDDELDLDAEFRGIKKALLSPKKNGTKKKSKQEINNLNESRVYELDLDAELSDTKKSSSLPKKTATKKKSKQETSLAESSTLPKLEPPKKTRKRRDKNAEWSPPKNLLQTVTAAPIVRPVREKVKAAAEEAAAVAAAAAVQTASKPVAARTIAAKAESAAAAHYNKEMSAAMSKVLNNAIEAARDAAFSEIIDASADGPRRRTRALYGQLAPPTLPQLQPPTLAQPLPQLPWLTQPQTLPQPPWLTQPQTLPQPQPMLSLPPILPQPPPPTAAPKRGRRKRASPADTLVAALTAVTVAAAPAVPTSSAAPRRGRGRGNGRVTGGRDLAVAEIAARAPTVGFVDLVSSPIPPIHGVINVDSEGENENTKSDGDNKDVKVAPNDSLDISFEEENPEISVKVIWMGQPEIFKLRKYQKFMHLFKTLAARENTDEENVVCNLESRIITAQDTPASIGYKIYHFIDGRVLTRKLNGTDGPAKKTRDANRITLKIQSDQWKRPLLVDLLKTEKFKILYIKCAEELDIPYTNLTLSFDGEHMEFNATPIDLELEGGEAIDLRIKK